MMYFRNMNVSVRAKLLSSLFHSTVSQTIKMTLACIFYLFLIQLSRRITYTDMSEQQFDLGIFCWHHNWKTILGLVILSPNWLIEVEVHFNRIHFAYVRLTPRTRFAIIISQNTPRSSACVRVFVQIWPNRESLSCPMLLYACNNPFHLVASGCFIYLFSI